MFGFGKKKDKQDKQKKADPKAPDAKGAAAGAAAGDEAAAPGAEPARPRNDEVTVQITKTGLDFCRIGTAMSTYIGTRAYQQDAAYVCEPVQDVGTAFAILCDGMGGMEGGERVSSDVVAFMANRIATLAPGQEIPAFYERAAADANEMVLAGNAQRGEESGTTLISAMITNEGMFWLSVGDSRIYIIRAGEIARVTRDHNFALELQEMVDAGRITQQQADADPRKDALVSYIGAPVLEIVDVGKSAFPMLPGDIVLLCSDGLTKALPDEAILKLILENRANLNETARILPLAAFDASPGGLDNTSVILMQYNGAAQCS